MPTCIWKEVMLPGVQEDARGNRFRFTRNDCLAAHRNLRRMLSRGVPVPCVWEHQAVEAGDSDERKAAYARYTFGHIEGTRINARGAVELAHHVPDPKDVDQLLKTRFVSPKVYPLGYSDSRGGTYAGATIAHVAATPTPVQFWQRPFQLSKAGAVYLSYSRTEGNDVADEKDKSDEKSSDEKPPPKEKSEEKSEDTTDEFDSLDEGASSDPTGIQSVIEALREVGFLIPDEVVDEKGLVIAIKAGGKPDAGDDPFALDGGAGGTGGGSGGTTPGASAPMMMSDDRAKGYAKKDREELVRRIKRLFETGRIDRVAGQKLLQEARAVELSYRADGEYAKPVPLLARIEVREELPAWSAWSKDGVKPGAAVDLSTTTVEPPEKLVGDEESDKAVVAEQERLAGLYSVGGAKK